MEVHLAQNQETGSNNLAAKTGRGTDELVQQAVARMLEYDTSFLEAVEEGRAAARRGDLLEHDEVVERMERMFAHMRIRWTTPASDDLAHIVARIRDDNPDAALRKFPFRGRLGH